MRCGGSNPTCATTRAAGPGPFYLLPWQKSLVRELFGWQREDGTRLYRRAYVEAPRKSVKSMLAGAIGLYMAYGDVEAAILDAAKTFDLRDVNYDRWNSSQIVQQLENEGISMVQVGQGFANISAPTKGLQRLVIEGKLRHGGNPLLRWCVGNLAVKMDPAGNVKPDRDRSGGRIDPVAALVMALDGWQRRGQRQRRTSVYETQDLVVV